jgi:hypothetical protein
MLPCSLVDSYRCFGGSYDLCLRKEEQKAGMNIGRWSKKNGAEQARKGIENDKSV